MGETKYLPVGYDLFAAEVGFYVLSSFKLDYLLGAT